MSDSLYEVWKFPLNNTGTNRISMPIGAAPLCVGVQDNRVMMWALVPTKNAPEDRLFLVTGTGFAMDHHPGQYIGTAFIHHLVWHVFEENR